MNKVDSQPLPDITSYIYGLIDPITQEVRYIGQAVNPKLRLIAHISEAKEFAPNSAKSKWLNALRAQGVRPEIVIIEECGLEVVSEAEIFWVRYFKSLGAKLTNGKYTLTGKNLKRYNWGKSSVMKGKTYGRQTT